LNSEAICCIAYVRFWHKADKTSCLRLSAFGGKADISPARPSDASAAIIDASPSGHLNFLRVVRMSKLNLVEAQPSELEQIQLDFTHSLHA